MYQILILVWWDALRSEALDADSIVGDIGRAAQELHAVVQRVELPQSGRRTRASAASTLHVVGTAGLADPAKPSGGNIYNRWARGSA